jgi:hypothetical protein
MYWKLNENNTRAEFDYPRDMSIWRGVPVPLDAAFKFADGKPFLTGRFVHNSMISFLRKGCLPENAVSCVWVCFFLSIL